MSDPRYTVRLTMHARLSRGGYMYGYEVLYEGVVIGSHAIVRETRNSPQQATYRLGETEYPTPAEFKAAHQRSLAAAPAEEGR